MSDTLSQGSGPEAAPPDGAGGAVVGAAPGAVPAPAAAPPIDYNALATAMIAQGVQVPAAEAQAPAASPAKPVAETNLWSKGQIVSHSWHDIYEGRTRTRYGIVLDTLPNEGAGARSIVGWLHETSGPIGDEQLEGA